jgi:hypothetical protein
MRPTSFWLAVDSGTFECVTELRFPGSGVGLYYVIIHRLPHVAFPITAKKSGMPGERSAGAVDGVGK